jgi:hypothetical protein
METVKVDPGNRDSSYTRSLCEHLENGNILTIAPTPFVPGDDDCAFLRQQNQAASGKHKNIAYKPHLRKVTGVDSNSTQIAERTSAILGAYSEGALAYLSELFPDYSCVWKVDYASFRPVEEQGRSLPLSHRNDLMHLDAFPTRPTYGGRILRAFTNIHPDRDRVWGISYSFPELVSRYADDAGLRGVVGPIAAARRWAISTARIVGVRSPVRSAYDEFMLKFHHYLKSNKEFQQQGQCYAPSFSPGTTWIAFTDQVAHRVVSGQYAIEQTCIVPLSAMVLPSLAPVNVLARAAGAPLIPAHFQHA